MSPRRLLTRAGWLLAATAFLVGCAHTTRVATLNREVSGSSVAKQLQQQLAVAGIQHAHVICAETVVINLGRVDTCHVIGAGPHGTVHFAFSNYSGDIKHGSVSAG